MLAACFDVVVLEELQNAVGCSADVARKANRHTTYVDRMESIHVLAIIDSLDNLLLRDMLRQRKLDNKPIDIRVVIKFVNLSQ